MDRPADLVHRGERRRARLPRVRIDFDLDDVAAPPVRAVRVAAIAVVVPRHLGRPLVRLRDDERSVALQILARREPSEARAHLLRAPLQDAAHDHARARRDRRTAVGHDGGVGGVHLDAVVRKAERVGDDLRVHGARPLTDFRARHQDANTAFGERE